jgi:hypothetical protein
MSGACNIENTMRTGKYTPCIQVYIQQNSILLVYVAVDCDTGVYTGVYFPYTIGALSL